MTDKKTFGSFIKAKRTEKGYSQKELAELLFVTEGAVSKWERGVSYPDITLIPDICRVLDISEHELITASTDTDSRRIKHEARNFRVIRNTWFWAPTISYQIALAVCFITNLAVEHRLSWFFIVLSALILAFTWVPTVTRFFPGRRLISFVASTYLGLVLLLLTCSIYVGDMSWFINAALGILIGYTAVFLPIILRKGALARYNLLITSLAACVLTVLILINVNAWQKIMLLPAILICCYAYSPAIFIGAIITLRLDGFIKAGISLSCSAVIYYLMNLAIDVLLGTSSADYAVNLADWVAYTEGNVYLIALVSLLLTSAVFFYVGRRRIKRMSVSDTSPKERDA